jgi:hypothetical protein
LVFLEEDFLQLAASPAIVFDSSAAFVPSVLVRLSNIRNLSIVGCRFSSRSSHGERVDTIYFDDRARSRWHRIDGAL